MDIRPYIGRSIYELVSNGRSAGHWIGWLFEDHFADRNFDHIPSIGCGVGDHEIAMAKYPLVRSIDAFDYSNESIRIAKEKSETLANKKINFFTGDFNNIEISPGKYDMILCSGSLHHVKELEHLLSQIKNGLKTDGVFIANEYVGACYNIYPESQISAINNILDGLPNELKINPSQKFKNASIEDVFQRDPTEAVRSILIPTFLRIYFKYVDERKCGGTILHPIYPFLNVETLEKNHILHQSLVNTLIAMDQNYMNEGKSDFSFFICRNQ